MPRLLQLLNLVCICRQPVFFSGPLALDASDYRLLQALKATKVYGDTDADVLRDIVFSWWSEAFLGVPDIPE